MLLNNEWDNNEIKGEIKRYFETYENEDTTIQNLWDTGKAIIREQFIALQTYLNKRKKETRKSSNKQSNFTLKWTCKKTTKPKVSRSKEIIKITV